MPPRQQQQQRRGVLGIAAWIHSITIAPLVNFWLWTVLGSIEESTTSLIREALALVQRSINGFSAWTLSGKAVIEVAGQLQPVCPVTLLSAVSRASCVIVLPACMSDFSVCCDFDLYAVFNRDYKRQLRGRWEETWAAYSWWREQAPPSKQGTLNAVLARRYGESQGDCCTKSGTCLKRYALRSMLCSVGSSSIRCVLCNMRSAQHRPAAFLQLKVALRCCCAQCLTCWNHLTSDTRCDCTHCSVRPVYCLGLFCTAAAAFSMVHATLLPLAADHFLNAVTLTLVNRR